MGQIQVMSPALANQIAAGEVVERPASCVKELVENSLDAGATKISVTLGDGGITLIAVEDDGHGMSRDDAVLAFARHATSKVKHEYELTRIHTLGFRGEALASIAAVARVTLQTRLAADEHGYEVKAEGSDATSAPEAIGRRQGTRVEVRDLFFNTPARLKYLRTVQTEQARCVEVVQRAALSRPDVAFRCEVDGRVLFQTPGKDNALDVLAVLYGFGEAKQFLRIEGQTPDYKVYGFIGRPTQGRSSRAHGNWFINGRPIRNIALHQAVIAGYHGRLMINRHPVYALYIEMDPTLVDVNIHPHKSEVRFSEEGDVKRLVQSAVADVLAQAFLVPPVSRRTSGQSSESHGQRPDRPVGWEVAESRPVVDSEGESRSVGYPSSHGGHRHSGVASQNGAQQQLPLTHPPARPSSREIAAASQLYQNEATQQRQASTTPLSPLEDGRDYQNYGADERSLENVSSDGGETSSESAPEMNVQSSEDPRQILRDLRPIGQVLGTYILAEADNSLFVIDQHAAHERVLYERFRQQTAETHLKVLPLLTPLTVNLLPSQFAVFKAYGEVLDSLGITAEEFGGTEIIVRSIPQVWEGLDASTLLEELLQQLDSVIRTADPREALREKIIMRACKSAIKANHRLSEMEIRALCEALPTLEDPYHCPHGRPVFIKLTNHDLEREFRRIV